jgi:glycine/serine hydroxymethyltransferase
MIRIAELIDRALAKQDDATLARVKDEVKVMTGAFPLYQAASATRHRVRRTA